MINWVNGHQPRAALSVSPLVAALIVGVSIALSLISTTLVAWQPAKVRPLEVLRNE